MIEHHKGRDYSSLNNRDLKIYLHYLNRSIKDVSKRHIIVTRQIKNEYLDWLYTERHLLKKEMRSRKKSFFKQLLSCKKGKSPIS